MVKTENISLRQSYRINMNRNVQLGLKRLFYIRIDDCNDKTSMFDYYIQVKNDARKISLAA